MGYCWRPLSFLIMDAFEKRVHQQISGQVQLDFTGIVATEQLAYRATLQPSHFQSGLGRKE